MITVQLLIVVLAIFWVLWLAVGALRVAEPVATTLRVILLLAVSIFLVVELGILLGHPLPHL